MDSTDDIQSDVINEAPDLLPVEIPDHTNNPTIDDRISKIESILHI